MYTEHAQHSTELIYMGGGVTATAPLPKQAVLGIKAAPAAPLARRQRRAQPWTARPAHAGPHRYRNTRRSDVCNPVQPVLSKGYVLIPSRLACPPCYSLDATVARIEESPYC